MLIKDIQTEEKLEAVIEPIEDNDYKTLKKNKAQYKWFNWDKYKGQEVYKLRLKDNATILGLMCIIDHTDPGTNAIEIELLEVGDDNVGDKKKLDNIAGCLIAFACRESYKRGHEGWVFLTPKTDLIPHYISHYGLAYTPPLGTKLEGVMVAQPIISQRLVRKYLD
ncbi:hypothetical protein CLV51_10131 [Chitinophaga niastensis]|uniref:N-acetyltransferase domain-containing protein n=1 Tax=Chitinophaga niastensis TaxID=536980 RepID=A0A2P8HR56_CHINA|nr:hypothetical protein [Chitinophaga niastensis]PSL48706.1 hypothetical protein CLV51_10131 [Chitinophaga niastensis]